jgi:general secretion pathway protein E/type IV pilus assembly protein PilB
MNETDEFIIDAFKQQGLATDELIAEIKAELDAEPDNEVGDRDLALMNVLMERTGMPKQEIINYLSSELNMEAVDLEQISLPDETLQLVTPEWARQYEVVPIGENGMEVEMVFANPLDHNSLDNLSHLLGKSINPKFSYRGDVLAMIEQAYGNGEETKLNDFFEGMEGEDIEIGDGVKPEDVSEEDAPIIKYVHSVIKDAFERRASDIHMEPLEKKI